MYVIKIFAAFARLKQELTLHHFFKSCTATHEFDDVFRKRVNFVDELYKWPLWWQCIIVKVFLQQMIVHGCKGAKFV
jgi:hypothetical protein